MPEFELIDYNILEKIGEGSFSEVYRVKHKRTGDYYAAKKLTKVYMDSAEALQCSEIQVMKMLDYHPNVVSFVDILHDELNGNVTLIMELMDESLYDYIRGRKRCLSEKRVKGFLYQIVCGLNHLHRNGIFHRDIKPENILIKAPNKLKESELVQLADFGSICSVNQEPPYSAYISTRWYRPPECLLTSGYYGPKMDIWAVGCCFYEMLTLNPLFPGDNELDQLNLIHEVVGSPSPAVLAKFRHLNEMKYEFPKRKPIGFRNLVKLLSNYGVDVLNRTLAYAPETRISAAKLLQHLYFEDLCKRRSSSRLSCSMQSLDDVGDGSRARNGFQRKASKCPIRSTESLNQSMKSCSANTSVIVDSKPKLTVEMMKNRNLERMWGMNPGPGKKRLGLQIRPAHP
ncbi:MAPK/MAK/MRK overlapping kinase-like [Toxorhynchites rutilus septentrionalis]|uniref:MAPK/MAK/MRK overlapping kinase-like n=1 Tax=Toxorhynchites rutilus septentrionalis TaxID=329112 RepID=UPI00247B2474|nr:MAPK/MAK/MRK overlapping kinase-like [Toxorhynchites rutilus septentrionalis]